MLLKNLLLTQLQLERIKPIQPSQRANRIDEELDSYARLKKRNEDYLNQYDELFRLITIWLLVQGYDLTNIQPHQVLKVVCQWHCPDCDIEQMIQQRHLIKKRLAFSVQTKCTSDLQQCLHYFQTQLQAYVSLA